MPSMDPAPLQDLQDNGLESRDRMSNPWRNPMALNDAHWDVQPRWAKIMIVALSAPPILFLGIERSTGNVVTPLHLIAMVSLGLAGLVGLFFVVRAYWRMDI